MKSIMILSLNNKENVKMEDEERDINWSVDFEITVNGESMNFWDLTEYEQEIILENIKNDSYSGTF